MNKLYLAIHRDFKFIFTERIQYKFESDNRMYKYKNYTNVSSDATIEEIKSASEHFKKIYPLLNTFDLCGGDYKIVEL